MTRLLALLARRSRPLLMAGTLCAAALVGVADYVTGYEISFSIFYLATIAVAAWFVGWRFALLVSVFSVASWLAGDLAAGARYASRFVPGWNAAIALAFYVVVVGALARLRALQDRLEAKVRERTAALTDEMTKREALERELLAVIEREQRRIGHDLHDSLCQHLTATSIAARILGDKLAARSLPEHAEANRIVRMLEEGILLARNLARGLAPVALEAEGLTAALHELARTTAERFGIQCRLEARDPVPIDDPTAAIHLFRIAQEAISNAIRHGRAQNLAILLKAAPAGIEMQIRDDGCGFQPGPPEQRGMGLHIMRHRAAMIGASFEIRPQPPGSVVTCVLREAPASETL